MIKIIVTSDGSHSLLNTDLDETYHSIHGAVQESLHVFIKNGLDLCKDPVNVFEVGFGTGLNALLTAQTGRLVNYTSIEAFPIGDLWRELNFSNEVFKKIHECPWEEFYVITEKFRLKKIENDLRSFQVEPNSYDVIYFDAFAPSKQPEMWEFPVLEKVCSSLKSGGIFVTYCAKGQLKRDLKSLGLTVETLSGPPGKKEMTRGTKT